MKELVEDMSVLIKQAPVCLFYFSNPSDLPSLSIMERLKSWVRRFPQIEARYIFLNQHPELFEKYEIVNTPTAFVYIKGTCVLEYHGYFSVDDLMRYTENYIYVMEVLS